MEAYSPSTDTWATKASLPEGRVNLASAATGGILYILGGLNTDAVSAYNPATNVWTTKASLPEAELTMGAAVAGGLIYVVGGKDSNSTPLATMAAYWP